MDVTSATIDIVIFPVPGQILVALNVRPLNGRGGY